MRILITGGAGYIGSHTAKMLANAGFQPVVLYNLSTGHRTAVRWGPLIEGDVGDVKLVRDVLRVERIEAVVHFAASAYVGESIRKPSECFRNNVVNSLALLEAMRSANVTRIVFSSSCATYGTPERIPINQEQRPVNPYGESKLFVERALYWHGVAYGLQWVALRYFNAAGADPDGEAGEDHDPETHLIPLAFQAAMGKIPCLQIDGDDYATPDGTAIRDYIHVTDLASAHLLAVRYLLDGGGSLVLNLGTGSGHTVKQVVDAVENAGGCQLPVVCAGRRPGDPAGLVADPARARRILGWRPEFSGLDCVARTAWKWAQNGSVRSR